LEAKLRISILSTAVVATSFVTAAFAADLPSRQAPIAPIYVPAFTWTGFYIGLNAGGAWADTGHVVVNGPIGGAGSISGSDNGAFIGGAQIGYNFQSGAVVWGVETDIQYVGRGSNASWGQYTWWNGVGGDDGGYFGTVRGRVGYAFDRALIYVTGGLAYGGLNSSPLTGNATSNVGWTIGGGLEYALTNNWTVKLEGLYVDLERDGGTRSFINPPGGLLPGGLYTASGSGGNGAGVFRVGVNYKF